MGFNFKVACRVYIFRLLKSMIFCHLGLAALNTCISEISDVFVQTYGTADRKVSLSELYRGGCGQVTAKPIALSL